MLTRRFVFAALSVLLVALPAAANPSRECRPRRINSVTIHSEGTGTLIAVTFAGRRHPRLLRSSDPIDAYAVADVDNDGDLDILATSNRHGLLLWRNAGRGRFVFASPSRVHLTHPRAPEIRHRPRLEDGPIAADDRYEAAMPRAPGGHWSNRAAAVVFLSDPFTPPAPTVHRPGRAPPTASA